MILWDQAYIPLHWHYTLMFQFGGQQYMFYYDLDDYEPEWRRTNISISLDIVCPGRKQDTLWTYTRQAVLIFIAKFCNVL